MPSRLPRCRAADNECLNPLCLVYDPDVVTDLFTDEERKHPKLRVTGEGVGK